MEKLNKMDSLKYFSLNYTGDDSDIAFCTIREIIDSEEEEFEIEYLDAQIEECEKYYEETQDIFEVLIKNK